MSARNHNARGFMYRNTILRLLFTGGLLVAPLAAPPTAHAASQDECAIWLCLPLGFAPSACSPAWRAFVKRVFRFRPKPPLPAFGSCAVEAEDITYNQGYRRFNDCPAPYDVWDTAEAGRDGTYTLPIGQAGSQYQITRRRCVRRSRCYWRDQGEDSILECPDQYAMPENPEPDYVTMFIDGQTCGPFHYGYGREGPGEEFDDLEVCAPTRR